MNRIKTGEAWYALLFLLPLLFTLGIFFVYAFARTIYFSFTDYNLFSPPEWVGLRNYQSLFDQPNFVRALRNTISYSLIVTIAQTSLALLLATVLNQKIRGIFTFRTIYYLPSILSSAAVTLVFLWLYQRTGFINYAITWLNAHALIFVSFAVAFVITQAIQVAIERARGLPAKPHDPALAVISFLVALAATGLLLAFGTIGVREVEDFRQAWLNTRERWMGVPIALWAIILQNIYTTIPTLMLLYLAGLQDIPKSLYEAAALDGATVREQFLHVTVPMLRPVTFLVLTLSLIGTLQVFDQVAFFGNVAPLESVISVAYYVYNEAFSSGGENRVGLASAAAIVLALLTLVVVLLQRRFGISEKGH